MNSYERIKEHLIVIIGYILLTIVLTYPIVLNISTKVTAKGGDVWVYLWNIWWLKKSLFELGISPYYTYYMFYPTGISLAYTTMSLYNSFLAIILRYFFDLITTYNILILSTFVLSGYFMYLLTKYFIGNKIASFVSGIIFAFSPYHTITSFDYLNLATIQWIPLYILFLFKTMNENNKKNPIMAAFFLFLISLSEFQYMGFAFIFTVFFLLYHLWMEKEKILNKNFVKRFFISILFFGIMALPFLYPLLVNPHTNVSLVSFYYSQDIVSFFIPSNFHPIFGKYSLDVLTAITADNMNFGGIFPIGYIVIFLVGFYAINKEEGVGWILSKINIAKSMLRNPKVIKRLLIVISLVIIILYYLFRSNIPEYLVGISFVLFYTILYILIRERKISFWALSAILFFLLAMGPFLRILGSFHSIFIMPYLFLMALPGFSIFRTPYRFDLFLMLSLAVLSAYGIKEILLSVKRKNIVMFIISILIIFEFLVIPFPMSSVEVPEIYIKISKESDNFAIMDIPISPYSRIYSNISWEHNIPIYLFYQIHHNKKIVGGYISNTPDYVIKFFDYTPVFHQIFNFNSDSDIICQDISEIGIGVLNYYNISYVLIHKGELKYSIYPKNASEISEGIVMTILKEKPVYYDDDIVAYKVPKAHEIFFIRLDDGWSPIEVIDNVTIRRIKNNAKLMVISTRPRKVELKVDTMECDANTLRIYYDRREIKTSMFEIPSGENVIELNVSGICSIKKIRINEV